MNFASTNSFGKPQIKAPTFNSTILLGSVALFILFAVAFYLASGTPGTTLNELAFMAVAP